MFNSRRLLPSKRISLPPLSSPIVECLLTPSEAAAARRKCTIVEEDDEEALEEREIEAKIVRDDSAVSRSSRSSIPDAHHTLDLALIQGSLTSSKPLIPSAEATEATPAPFPVTSQIGTGLSRQGSLRRYIFFFH